MFPLTVRHTKPAELDFRLAPQDICRYRKNKAAFRIQCSAQVTSAQRRFRSMMSYSITDQWPLSKVYQRRQDPQALTAAEVSVEARTSTILM